MRNPFRKKPSTPLIEKFTGLGTVFMGKIINFNELVDHLGLENLIEILKQHLSNIHSNIEKRSGAILQWTGDAVFAFWAPHHTNPNHAQLAFDAACDILDSFPGHIAGQRQVTYDIEIVLGTGDMAGDFLGHQKQFQIVGKAMSIADHLSKAIRGFTTSSVWMSQGTVDLVNTSGKIEETETIIRVGSNDFKVFKYPSNCNRNVNK